MCVQYRGVLNIWGGGAVFSTVGDILSTMGISLGYFEHCGECSVPWGEVSTVGDIMVHVRGYHEYLWWCSVPWGILSFVI